MSTTENEKIHPSYTPENGHNHCTYLGLDAGICWGQVNIEDEMYDEESGDSWLIYACEGHSDMVSWSQGKYQPPPDNKTVEIEY